MATKHTAPQASASLPGGGHQASGATVELARYTSGLRYEDLPAATADYAKRLLLDGIGCLLAGIRGEPGQMAARAIARNGASADGQSLIACGYTRGSARDAAFVNGVTLYSVGVNDIHRESVSHPGGCVVPVVLALGEWQRAPGTELISAMVAGYEIMGRLGRAMMPSHWDRGFHSTGTFGTFGAAAAACAMLRLSVGHTTAAFGIAGSQAAGLQAFHTDGSLTMIFHAGRAAQNGIEAALLAQQGFSGPRTVFEDKHGFVHATADDVRMDALLHGLGNGFEIDATSMRPYYGCTLTIAASDAMARILARREPADPVVASAVVRCHPSAVSLIDNPDPQTLLGARLSMQFNVALVIVKGDVFIGDPSANDLRDPQLRALLARIVVEADDGMTTWGSGVSVRFEDGRTDSEEIRVPKGGPDNPMSWDDMHAKFTRLLAPLDQDAAVEKVYACARDVERSGATQLLAAVDTVARAAQR